MEGRPGLIKMYIVNKGQPLKKLWYKQEVNHRDKIESQKIIQIQAGEKENKNEVPDGTNRKQISGRF